MTKGVTGAVARYVLDASDDDLKRLLKISELTAEFARVALDTSSNSTPSTTVSV